MIKRNLLVKLNKYLYNEEFIAILGARQVGKTTLMTKLYDSITESKDFITFEDVSILNLFENDFDTFVKLYVSPNKFLFIDEFQYAIEGGKKLKQLYDTTDIKIIISGSSTTNLSIHGLSYLVGRILIFELNHVAFDEFIDFKNNKLLSILAEPKTNSNIKLFDELLDEYLIYGGYPKIITSDQEQKEFLLKNILNTFLLKEIKEILNYKNIFEFEKLLTYLSINNSQIINKLSIAKDLDLSLYKINEIIKVLEQTYVLKLITPFHTQQSKELIKSPKSYLLDQGLRNSLINNFNAINLRQDLGAIYEHFIFYQLIIKGYDLKFWNYRNSYEVDFIIQKDGKLIPIEVKSKIKGLTKSMKAFIDKYDPDIFYVFNKDFISQITYKNTNILFVHYTDVFTYF